MQAKFEEFKEVFIEQIKSSLKVILKDEIREIIKKELSDLENISATVNLLQKHASSLLESNIALQIKFSVNLSFQLTIVRGIVAEHVLESLTYLVKKSKPMRNEEVLKKVKKLINEEAEAVKKPLIELILLIQRIIQKSSYYS